jgi:hypothetical protein
MRGTRPRTSAWPGTRSHNQCPSADPLAGAPCRSGDLLGRRRIFITGILILAGASLLDGFATDQAWLLSARVQQGVGGAMAAPTALSLIAVTFRGPAAEPRHGRVRVHERGRRRRRSDRRRAARQLPQLALGVLRRRARFTTLPDEPALQATVVALEEHGFSVEVAGDLDAARRAVLARIPAGSSVMTNASVTLEQTGIADAINDGGGRWESARNTMFALDFATQAQQMKAIGGQPDYALGSVHAITAGGTLAVSASSRTFSSIRSALVSERMTSNISFW